MSLGPNNDIFILYINSMDFLALPYKFDLTPERDPKVTFKADISLGFSTTTDLKSIKMPNLWSNRDFITSFQESLEAKDP